MDIFMQTHFSPLAKIWDSVEFLQEASKVKLPLSQKGNCK